MKGGRKFKGLKREVDKKPTKRMVVIYCEDEKAAPDYFNALKRKFTEVIVDVQIFPAAGVPKTIADKVVQAKKSRKPRDSFDQKDEYWALFDRDEHLEFEQSVHRCEAAGVGVAYAIPCFELWLILHFEDYNQLNDHKTVQKYLEKICPDYDRNTNKTTNCDKLINGLEIAEKRAEKQCKARQEEGKVLGNPSTTVYQLTRRIRGV